MEIFLILFFIVFCFSFVLIFGAPYLPTMQKQAEVALDLLDLKEGQVLYELGCGDGKLLLYARRRGIKSVGVELNPLLFSVAWLRTLKYRKDIKIKYGNFWNLNLSQADGVYVFLLKKFMSRLDKKLSKELKNGTKLASYAFEVPNKKYAKLKSAIYLYRY